MRRLFAIALTLLLGLPGFAPLLGLAQAQQAHLPACCRRAGAHHCMDMAATQTAADRQPTLRMTCPAFPRVSEAVHTSMWSTQTSLTPHGTPHTSPTSIAQAEAGYRLAQSRAQHKRGPPASVNL